MLEENKGLEMELNLDQMEDVVGGATKPVAGGYKTKPAKKTGCKIVKILPGDTLTKIANRNNTTVAKLMQLNPCIKDKNLIRAGYYLYVPA